MAELVSKLFTIPPDDRLKRCAEKDTAHITPGSVGDHVKRIQIALNQQLDVFLIIDGKYGPKTADAVKAFKEAQIPPLRQKWQAVADKIVGIGTISALDAGMKAIEDAPPPPMTGMVSLTPIGPPHNHNDCVPFLDSDNFQGRISHLGTPINPLRTGRMICIGGTNEVKYLGFENYVPDPAQDPSMMHSWVLGRPFTRTLPDRCASDICLRSAPIDEFMKKELKRIAKPGCRLTYASNIGAVSKAMPYLMSLGRQLQFEILTDKPSGPLIVEDGLHVVVVAMDNLN